MITVALAGATTGFGLTVLHMFLRLNERDGHPYELVLLSRSPQPDLAAKGVDVRPVDYSKHTQLVKALSDVHTLLSVIGGSGEAIHNAQLALIEACREAGVKRFAPSEYAGISNEGIDLYAPKAEVWDAAQAAAKETGMQVTRFLCGLFMSILATGTTKPITDVGKREGAKSGEEEALAGLRPWNFVINLKAGTADLPGDGSAKLVFTDMRDVATFLYRALSLETWPEHLGMRGDVKSFREAVEIVEKVQGRRFLVKENSIEDMEAKNEDPGKLFYNQVRAAVAKGWAMVPDDLNKCFPDVKPVTCEEFVEKWWRGVELGAPSSSEDQSFM